MKLDGPSLDKIKVHFDESVDFSKYPFTLNIIKNLKDITFTSQVTFLVGENGTGKSTILEALAIRAGLGKEGGSKNINFTTTEEDFTNQVDSLSSAFTLSWRKKNRDAYFLRAESFFNLANYIDHIAKYGGQSSLAAYEPYGGKSLHEQSHGESFLSLFKNRFGKGGFFILDEPEAALSPQRQLAFLRIMHDLCVNPETQFVIATHSPILLSYPGAVIYSCDKEVLTQVEYTNTNQYQVTKNFLDNPEQYFKHLFSE